MCSCHKYCSVLPVNFLDRSGYEKSSSSHVMFTITMCSFHKYCSVLPVNFLERNWVAWDKYIICGHQVASLEELFLPHPVQNYYVCSCHKYCSVLPINFLERSECEKSSSSHDMFRITMCSSNEQALGPYVVFVVTLQVCVRSCT